MYCFHVCICSVPTGLNCHLFCTQWIELLDPFMFHWWNITEVILSHINHLIFSWWGNLTREFYLLIQIFPFGNMIWCNASFMLPNLRAYCVLMEIVSPTLFYLVARHWDMEAEWHNTSATTSSRDVVTGLAPSYNRCHRCGAIRGRPWWPSMSKAATTST